MFYSVIYMKVPNMTKPVLIAGLSFYGNEKTV